MTQVEVALLRNAKRVLEHTSLAMALSNALGSRFDDVLRMLPVGVRAKAEGLAQTAIATALDIAVGSLERAPDAWRGRRWHTGMTAVTGAVGGAFGMLALAAELPVSTTILLRAIADIAARHGEDLSDPAVRLACLEVFALGGAGKDDDAVDTGYFAVRAGLAGTVREAARYMAAQQMPDRAAPIMVKLLSKLSAKFSGPLANKVMAQALPLLGAAGGAAVNAAFMRHFTALADAHFSVRALERRHGGAVVRAAYDQIRV